MGLKVLSLFDGYAGGLEALNRAGVKVDEYHAFEIDKYAIQGAKKNHPEIIHHGEIHFMTDFTKFKGFDLLIGGSPCQGFSSAGKGLNFSDPRSQLFFEFVRAKREMKPKYFMLENVKMKKERLDIISEHMGVQPVCINSALVSAQNRVRNYWCNWKVSQPKDKGILLKDIIENGVVDRSKSYCVDANYWKGGNLKLYYEKGKRQLVFKDKAMIKRSKLGLLVRVQLEQSNECLVRKLTVIECERLQTLPDNYTSGVSDTQRYRMLGNGWNIETVAHIFGENDAL